jgi:hypothetical protein
MGAEAAMAAAGVARFSAVVNVLWVGRRANEITMLKASIFQLFFPVFSLKFKWEKSEVLV